MECPTQPSSSLSCHHLHRLPTSKPAPDITCSTCVSWCVKTAIFGIWLSPKTAIFGIWDKHPSASTIYYWKPPIKPGRWSGKQFLVLVKGPEKCLLGSFRNQSSCDPGAVINVWCAVFCRNMGDGPAIVVSGCSVTVASSREGSIVFWTMDLMAPYTDILGYHPLPFLSCWICYLFFVHDQSLSTNQSLLYPLLLTITVHHAKSILKHD